MVENAKGGYEFAVVGDLHSAWDWADVEYFSASHYQTVWLTGDLGSSGSGDGVRVAASVASIRKRVFIMLGNNDAADHERLLAELAFQRGKQVLLSGVSGPPADGVGAVLVGYSQHACGNQENPFTLIATRPFAMGGGECSFSAQLTSEFGISSLEASVARLRQLVDTATTRDLIFLGHNGPVGLGERAHDIFGRDFAPAGGDYGDPDIADTVVYAKQRGHRVLAVIAGHMHYRYGQREQRRWQLRDNDTLYVNAACVPRHRVASGVKLRHHIAFTLSGGHVHAEERWL